MKWNDFVEKLAKAKKLKKTKGISMGTITNLIFAGAFDSFIDIPGDISDLIKKYKSMRVEALTALKSKSTLSKAKKNEIVGLADVSSAVTLACWRYQMNPLALFDLLDIAKYNIKTRGFEPSNTGIFCFKRTPPSSAPEQGVQWITRSWEGIFELPRFGQHAAFWNSLTKGYQKIFVYGIITDVEIKTYDNGKKERLIINIYNGNENIDNIVMWPDREGSGKISDMHKSVLKPPEWGWFELRPNVWNDRKGGILMNYEILHDRTVYGK